MLWNRQRRDVLAGLTGAALQTRITPQDRSVLKWIGLSFPVGYFILSRCGSLSALSLVLAVLADKRTSNRQQAMKDLHGRPAKPVITGMEPVAVADSGDSSGQPTEPDSQEEGSGCFPTRGFTVRG